jgi:hypothetical protein
VLLLAGSGAATVSGSWSDIDHLAFISTTVLSALLVIATVFLVIATWKQMRTSQAMERIEKARAERETTARLLLRHVDHYELTAMGSDLECDAHILAQTITAQGVRVTAVFRDQIVASTPPQTVEGGQEATIHVHIRDADQLALEHTDGRRDALITQLRLRAQPTNGPAVEWRWGESVSSPRPSGEDS